MTAQTIARPMAVLPLLASSTILPGVELSAGLGLLDHRQSNPVLDRAAGIHHLQLHQDLDARDRVHAVDPHQRRVPD